MKSPPSTRAWRRIAERVRKAGVRSAAHENATESGGKNGTDVVTSPSPPRRALSSIVYARSGGKTRTKNLIVTGDGEEQPRNRRVGRDRDPGGDESVDRRLEHPQRSHRRDGASGHNLEKRPSRSLLLEPRHQGRGDGPDLGRSDPDQRLLHPIRTPQLRAKPLLPVGREGLRSYLRVPKKNFTNEFARCRIRATGLWENR